MSARGQNASGEDATPVVTPEIAAEAAVWIARLHGPSRSPQMERDFRAWQARSAAHRKAFERSTDIWEAVPRIRVQDAFASASMRASESDADAAGGAWRGPRLRRRWPLLLALPALLVAAALFVLVGERGEAYATQVGEQREVMLDDGSRMTLNTDTQVRVELGAKQRSIDVQRGEALFEVAKDPHRPFVVHAGGSEVVAVGTVFSVRLADEGTQRPEALAVTLVEGQVSVRSDPSAWSKGLSPNSPVLMKAGQRLRLVKAVSTVDDHVSQQLDSPRVDRLLAWQRSEVVFDDMPLADAVADMNRYCRTPIVLIGGAALEQLRVSGQYRTGDNVSFAKAVSMLHGLKLFERAGRLELTLPH